MQRPKPTDDPYAIRPYRSSDAVGFQRLYESVWGNSKGRAWFEWRFEENPYVSEVPMVVAENGDELVGAEPCLVFRVRAGEARGLAYQPADWMVHPDHRRRGLFTRMTESVLERDAAGRPDFYFNFPSEEILPGLEKFGWRVVTRVPRYYRVQNPSRIARVRGTPDAKGRTMALMGNVANPVARTYAGLCDLFAPDFDDVTVSRREGVPVETLAGLYDRTVPDRLHVVRDEAFYDWRFDNPRWETTTYVARRDGDVVASLVACTEAHAGVRWTTLADVLPLGDGPVGALASLLRTAVGDAGDADLVTTSGETLPPAVLRRCAFRSVDAFPLSLLSDRATMVARPNSADGSWRFGDGTLTEADRWVLQPADRDIA